VVQEAVDLVLAEVEDPIQISRGLVRGDVDHECKLGVVARGSMYRGLYPGIVNSLRLNVCAIVS